MPYDIELQREDRLREMPPIEKLGFGRHFTDHMLVIDYLQDEGWHWPRVTPFEPFSLSPASLALHYGQSVFEGLKAFCWSDKTVHVFRLDDHVERLDRSATRMVMPSIDRDLVREGILKLIDVDRRWAPNQRGTALYIRPTIIATESLLGVRPAAKYRLFVIMSPVGAYYSRGMDPTRIYVEEEYSRVPAGGTGEAKTAGNYAASLLAATEAQRKGFDQVLWLDAAEHKYVEEVGTMNVFFVIDDTLITPSLSGTILPGITRRSVLTIARDWGVSVEERRITLEEVLDAQRDGRLQEAFGTGTAAVVAPIGLLHYQGSDYEILERENSLRERLYDEITGLQYGEVEDRHGWLTEVPKEVEPAVQPDVQVSSDITEVA